MVPYSRFSWIPVSFWHRLCILILNRTSLWVVILKYTLYSVSEICLIWLAITLWYNFEKNCYFKYWWHFTVSYFMTWLHVRLTLCMTTNWPFACENVVMGWQAVLASKIAIEPTPSMTWCSRWRSKILGNLLQVVTLDTVVLCYSRSSGITIIFGPPGQCRI